MATSQIKKGVHRGEGNIRLCVLFMGNPYGTATKSSDVKDGIATGSGATAISSLAEPV
jgi:hypothetical protein